MPDWTWAYEGYAPAQERLREALCTLGNGYFDTRGAAPECAEDTVHFVMRLARLSIDATRIMASELVVRVSWSRARRQPCPVIGGFRGECTPASGGDAVGLWPAEVDGVFGRAGGWAPLVTLSRCQVCGCLTVRRGVVRPGSDPLLRPWWSGRRRW
jgi:hypothetical protein